MMSDMVIGSLIGATVANIVWIIKCFVCCKCCSESGPEDVTVDDEPKYGKR